MWPWLRSEHFKKVFALSDRQKFLCKLCLLTCIGHILLLALSTCSCFNFQKQERFVVSSQHGNTVYVLSPLQKQIKSPIVQSGATSTKASKVIDLNTYQKLSQASLKTESKPSLAQISVAAPLAKEKKTNTPLVKSLALKKDSKQSVQKKANITISELKTAKKAQPLKQISKKTLPEKKAALVVVKKNDTDKVESLSTKSPAVLPVTEKKASVPLAQEVDLVKDKHLKPITPIEALPVEPLLDDLNKANEESSVNDDIDIDHVTFIGYEQLDSLAVQNKIQQIIQENFKSPIGIKKGVSCEYSVFVGSDGKSKTIKMVRSSGILIYDTSARAMLYRVEFPKDVWNKTITIVLGQ